MAIANTWGFVRIEPHGEAGMERGRERGVICEASVFFC